MGIGYVSIVMSEPNMRMKSCILKNASCERLDFLIAHNCRVLDSILDFNCKNKIFLFRVSSGFIPFASHPINTIDWCSRFHEEFLRLGAKARKYNIRLSFHPGQYTTLSSPNETVVARAVEDLRYQTGVLDCMRMDSTNKIILHIGGGYGDKPVAIERFIDRYNKLPNNIKQRLVIENDDKVYTARDVLNISERTGIPVVFDVLHHRLNHEQGDDEQEILQYCMRTWDAIKDGKPKVHYSQQAEGKRAGSHSLTIDVDEFIEFYKQLPTGVDIMLEVKDKSASALKCIEAVNTLI